jgi:hypothetical protein
MRRLTLALSLLASTALAGTPPAPPPGFAWHAVEALRASFLTPDGWHVREEQSEKTLAIFITEGAFTPPDEFDVGVTINAFLDNPGAPERVKKLIDGVAAKYGVPLRSSANGPFRILACKFDSTRKKDALPVRTNMLGIANPETRTAYLVIFESPVSRWDETWAKGKVVLENLALDAER